MIETEPALERIAASLERIAVAVETLADELGENRPLYHALDMISDCLWFDGQGLGHWMADLIGELHQVTRALEDD